MATVSVCKQTHEAWQIQSSLINNGTELHLHHGPIDLIVKAEGSDNSVRRAYRIAEERFGPVLGGLVSELETLRQPALNNCAFTDPVARRMWQATSPYADTHFITPMAAVAGSVADEVLSAITTSVDGLARVSVNNGGDIALWLAEGQHTTVGVADPLQGNILAKAVITSTDGIAGIATSGRDGRSLSCGIADSVTVLAGCAAAADAAATLIANVVDLPDNPKIQREIASVVDPDSDLGGRLVTIGLEPLSSSECRVALRRGLTFARRLVQQHTIKSACLLLQGYSVATGSFESIDSKPRVKYSTGAYTDACS